MCSRFINILIVLNSRMLDSGSLDFYFVHFSMGGLYFILYFLGLVSIGVFRITQRCDTDLYNTWTEQNVIMLKCVV